MRKLPVLAAFAHALRSTWNNLRFAWHISWPWLVILIPVTILFSIMYPPPPPLDSGTVPSPEQIQATTIWSLTQLLTLLLSILAFSSIAVNWHRYILKDELPQGAERLRLDGIVWRYLGNTFLIGLFVALMLIPIAILLSVMMALAGPPSIYSIYTSAIALVVFAMPLVYRLSLKLPAIAVGNDKFKIGDGWRATLGSTFELCLLGILFLLSTLGLAQLPLSILSYVSAGEVGVIQLLSLLIQQLLGWLMTILGITMLTSLYGFFVENRDF